MAFRDLNQMDTERRKDLTVMISSTFRANAASERPVVICLFRPNRPMCRRQPREGFQKTACGDANENFLARRRLQPASRFFCGDRRFVIGLVGFEEDLAATKLGSIEFPLRQYNRL